MGTKVGIGLKQDPANTAAAAREAIRNAVQDFGEKQPDIVFAFASIKYVQEDIIKGIKSIAPNALIVGGSVAGEINSYTTVFDGIVVQAISSDKINFAIGCGKDISKDSFKAGADAAKTVLEKSKEKLKLFIVFSDGVSGDGVKITEGIQSILGKDFPIVGGSLGDDYLFKKTWQYYNDQVLNDAVVGVGLSGDFFFGFGIKHGWQPIGLSMKLTKASGTILQEIDNEPALKVYQEYFGKSFYELTKEPLAKIAYTYPLGIAIEGDDELLIRTPITANSKGEIIMSAGIPEGTTIRLMIGDPTGAIEAETEAIQNAIDQIKGITSKFALVFNSMARNKILGLIANEENQKTQKAIGKDIPMVGFYSYGEYAPLLGKKNNPTYFHNETIAVLIIGEKD